MLADAAGHLPEVVMPYRFIRRPKYVLMEFTEYDSDDDLRKSIKVCFDEVKRRVANGGPGWNEYPREKGCETQAGQDKPQDPRGGHAP